MMYLRKTLFFLVSSYAMAILVYYILALALPDGVVFSSLLRMYDYHSQHPLQFILIPCIVYSALASMLTQSFHKRSYGGKFLLTILIIIVTVGISSIFGGMLWHYYDMKAGYFPENWVTKMMDRGFRMGLAIGWVIVLMSFPFNLVGALVCYFLTDKGARLFQIKLN